MEKSNQIELLLESGRYNTYSTNKFKNRSPYQKRNENEVVSEIPGTIIQIFVTEGENLLKGAPLLILEAMKMENIIRMPHDGKIKRILVEKKQKIGKHTVLMLLD